MGVSKEELLQKMQAEVDLAIKSSNNELRLREHLAKIHLLSELLLNEASETKQTIVQADNKLKKESIQTLAANQVNYDNKSLGSLLDF